MVEIFDGSGHLMMWESEVLDALFQQGLNLVVGGEKLIEMREGDGGPLIDWLVVQFSHVYLENRCMHFTKTSLLEN